MNGQRGATPVEPPITKRLVARRPPDDRDEAGWAGGIEDGEPVTVTTPCARLRAGIAPALVDPVDTRCAASRWAAPDEETLPW